MLLIGVLACAAAIGWAVAARGWGAAWELCGVEWPGELSFLDTRIITAAAESFGAGYDPLLENPRDPFGRPLNYPRIWHALAFLGVREAHAQVVGPIFVGLFLAGVVLAFRRLDLRAALLLLLFLVSPAVLFGVERGNNDLVVFFLLALALAVGRRSHAAGLLPILFGAVLKVYPAFALGYGLRENSRRALAFLGGAVAGIGIYLLATAGDLAAMSRVTEKAFELSYGIETTNLLLREHYRLDTSVLRPALTAGAALFLAAVFLCGQRRAAARPAAGEHIDGFRIGTGVYLGTFLLMSSWDYRLMFLFFAVPQLLDWIDDRDTARDLRLAAWVSLILVFLVVWKTGTAPVPHLVLAWMLFAGLGYLYMRALPRLRPSSR